MSQKCHTAGRFSRMGTVLRGGGRFFSAENRPPPREAIETREIRGNTLHITIPNAAVLFLRSTKS
ncbi:MAG: hypothetical protein VZR05_05145, partial [Lachnospiraceae bacterium]|nr:hypothetical protein [Lachnospiraceae bacterium]